MFARRSERDNETVPISILDWFKQFRPGAVVPFAGNNYQAFTNKAGGGASFYDNNSVVFACEANRLLLFSEARFQFQEMRRGRPGNLFGNETLRILEEPWEGATTGELLVQAELDVFAAGNSYWTRDLDSGYLLRFDPAKVKILTIGVYDPTYGRIIGERLFGYAYCEHGMPPVIFEPQEIAHYKPYPDLTNRFVGRSWISSCITDVDADDALTQHKRNAVRQGASLGYVAVLDKDVTPDDFTFFVEKFREDHERPENAGKTLFIGGGADVKTVGQTFENLEFRAVQGAGETRVAACSGVPPVIVGLSEGLSSATYSNYGQARRRLVDGTMRPLWRAFAASMGTVVRPPSGSRLWYDDRDIPFLRDDVKDQAEVFQANASALRTLIEAGFEPNASVEAVNAYDLARLDGKHTGFVSVQLQQIGQPPNDTQDNGNTDTPALPPANNGNGAAPAATPAARAAWARRVRPAALPSGEVQDRDVITLARTAAREHERS